MKLLSKLEALLFESRRWKFLAWLFVVQIMRVGIWYIPNLRHTASVAENPFANPFVDPNEHYLVWSWLGPFLAWVLGAIKFKWFLAFYFLCSVCFLVFFLWGLFSHLNEGSARKATMIFAVLPVSATSFFWIGLDSLTLLLFVGAFLSSQSVTLSFFFGALIGMQHFEQGFFGFGALLLAVTLSPRFLARPVFSMSFCARVFLGIILGKLGLILLFRVNHIEVNSGRWYWLTEHYQQLFSQFFRNFHWVIWSVLGHGWLVAVRYMDWGRKTLPFFVALLGLLFLLPIAEDQTRVLAIVSFPLLAAFWLLSRDFLAAISKAEVSALFLIGMLTPWAWVWAGIPRGSVFPFDVLAGIYELLSRLSIPHGPVVVPF